MSQLDDTAVHSRSDAVQEPPLDSINNSDRPPWIAFSHPSREECALLADQFQLHPLAVEDTIRAHQRAKLETYGDTVFIVLKTARYSPRNAQVQFGELHVFVGPGFVITVEHGEAPGLAQARKRIEEESRLSTDTSEAILYGILDWVVDGYAPVVDLLEGLVDETEEGVFAGESDASRRIYQLLRDVLEFQRATKPLTTITTNIIDQYSIGRHSSELLHHLRDVQDHALRVNERLDTLRQLLEHLVGINLTLVSITQNEDMKKISSWAAIFFAPTLIGAIYGMNFSHMPELDWEFGYPLAIALMLVGSTILYRLFRRKGWI